MALRPRRILVSYDGSSASRRALDAVADIAGYGSVVAVVGVVAGRDDLTGERRRLVDEARQALLDRHVVARCFAVDGDPADALLGYAAELDADLVVLARPSPARAVVVDGAACDVLLDA
jgi:nucleotide-binding universal stress UspA family protein